MKKLILALTLSLSATSSFADISSSFEEICGEVMHYGSISIFKRSSGTSVDSAFLEIEVSNSNSPKYTVRRITVFARHIRPTDLPIIIEAKRSERKICHRRNLNSDGLVHFTELYLYRNNR